jgi:hypothetical protein
VVVDCSSIGGAVNDEPFADVVVGSATTGVDSPIADVVGASARSRSGLFVHAEAANTAAIAARDQRLERITAPASPVAR